jgi:hypothetical protein
LVEIRRYMPLGDRGADASRTAGDERDLACQLRSRVARAMAISLLEFLVPLGTMKVHGAGDAGQGPTTFF